MPKKLVKKIKKVTAPVVETPEEDEETVSDEPVLKKGVKVVEIDEPEPIVPLLPEEKEEDIPVIEGEEDLDEEAALDDDEVDPFGDKWEQ
ncbi:MAG: hypothetical protein WCG07_01455 [Candidatus Taylorbacteria bacterium]